MVILGGWDFLMSEVPLYTTPLFPPVLREGLGFRWLCLLSRRLGPVDPSFRALSGRLKFTVRRHEIQEDSHSCCISHRSGVWGGGG